MDTWAAGSEEDRARRGAKIVVGSGIDICWPITFTHLPFFQSLGFRANYSHILHKLDPVSRRSIGNIGRP
jgi:hypothetical protein